MKIESIIKRPGGTVIDMDAPQRSYKFAPEDGVHESPHVASVDVLQHANALLRIREGFRLVDGEEGSAVIEPGATIDHSQTLIGSNVHNASYPLSGGETLALGELVQMAFEDSGLTHDGWNELPDEERYEFIDATLSELQVDGDAQQQPEQVQPEPVKTELEPVGEKKGGDESENAGGDDDQDDETEVKSPEQPEQPGQPAPVQEPAEQPQQTAPQDEPVDGPNMDMTRDELVESFKKRFGRDPSRHMNKTDIVNALSEED